eukprot:4030199-Amphidinium_carterae.1
MGVVPHTMMFQDGILRLEMSRTKTTGKDKRTETVWGFVSEKASLTEVLWLREGFNIWTSPPYAFARDYFLPKSDDAGLSPIAKMADYHYVAATTRALMADLPKMVLTDAGWDTGLWTEHSERH